MGVNDLLKYKWKDLAKKWKDAKTTAEKELKKDKTAKAKMPPFKKDLQKNLALAEKLTAEAQKMEKQLYSLGDHTSSEDAQKLIKSLIEALRILMDHSQYNIGKITSAYQRAIEEELKGLKTVTVEPLKALNEIQDTADKAVKYAFTRRTELGKLQKKK